MSINWKSINNNLPENRNDVSEDLSKEFLVFTENGKVSNALRVYSGISLQYKWLYSEDDDKITHWSEFNKPTNDSLENEKD